MQIVDTAPGSVASPREESSSGGGPPGPPLGEPPVVSLVGVRRRFGSRAALDGLALSVPQGGVTVLLGPNGAGKTTAIRVITGALRPDAGEVRTFGLDPELHGEQVRRRCGVVSAKPALYDRLSGRDNLRYAASLYGLDPDRAPIEASAARFGIAPALDDQVGGYSTGMKTRLALTRAVLHDPDLLLLDEPTSGLDPESSVAVLGLIADLASQGKTVVLCTHLLLEAEGLADQVVVLEAGVDLVAGHPRALTRKFFPNHQVDVEVEVPLDAARLRSLDGVLDAQIVAGGSAGGSQVTRLGLDRPERVADVIAAIVGAGGRIRRVQPRVPSLEDLYFAVRGVSRGAMTEVEGPR